MAEFTSVNADGGDDIFENLAHRSKTTMKLSPSVKEEEAADKAIKTEDGVEVTAYLERRLCNILTDLLPGHEARGQDPFYHSTQARPQEGW